MSFCPHCGTETAVEGSSFCTKCGGRLPGGDEVPAEGTAGEASAPEGQEDRPSGEEPAAGFFAEGGSPDETPTEVISGDAVAGEAPTEALPAAEAAEPTAVMPAATPAGAEEGRDGKPPGAKKSRQQKMIVAAVIIAVLAVAGGVLAYFQWFDSSGDALETVTIVETKTVEVDPDADPLEEPFNLTVDLLDGAIPDEVVQLEYLLAIIEIEVDEDGNVSGKAELPAVGADGQVMQGTETSLEIDGEYRNGNLKADWEFFHPFGTGEIRGEGELEADSSLNKDLASALLTGEYIIITDTDDGDTEELDTLTIYFDVDKR